MNEEIESLQGQVIALSMTLSAIIQTLPALNCAHAAVHLKMSQEIQTQEDAENETPLKSARIRNLILESYLELLSTVAQNAG